MKAKVRKPHGFTLVELLVVIVIIAALAGLSAPVILKQRKNADRTEALNNIRQIGLALVEFDSEYGSYPDGNTATEVKEATGTDLNFGGTFSNDYFRQLIANGLKSEKPFFCKAPYAKKGDEDITAGKALEKGEVGFGYIMLSQTDGQNSSGNPNRPVVVGPLNNAEPNWTFDPEPLDKAIVLRVDNSAKAETIRDDKFISVGNGRKMQDTGENTVWGSDVNPVLRGPEKRGQ